MSTTTTARTPGTATTDDAAQAASAITPLAMGLWVLVGGLLVYGITMTVIKASALFTG